MSATAEPTDLPTSAFDQMLGVIHLISLEDLARLCRHEYDDEVIVPEPGSRGAGFLEDARSAYVERARAEGRFAWLGSEGDIAWFMTQWHRNEAGSQVAQAFVDLGLFYSNHADVAGGARVQDLVKVLDAVAEQFVVALTEEYGPLN